MLEIRIVEGIASFHSGGGPLFTILLLFTPEILRNCNGKT